MDRLKALRELAFERKNFDGFLVVNEFDQFYFAGVPGSACLLMLGNGEDVAYVYDVNYDNIAAEAKRFDVEKLKSGEKLSAKVAERIRSSKVKKLAFGMLSYEFYRQVANELRGKTRLKLQGNLVWSLRKVKDEKEIELMRKAGEVTSAGMKVAYEVLRPGLTEIEVAAEIEYAMRKKGGYGIAFDTIVASGIRSAYPHGGCADREIRRGDLVVIDMGAVYEYYRSDMTRTLVAGRPSEKQKKFYEIVKTAQEKSYHAIKSKAKGTEVDRVARRVIEEGGLGERFVHGLGHGVGLEIHEPPTLSPVSKDKLLSGNVVTNEPGIYIPNFGGIRIEDTVLVNKNGAEKLTIGPYTLEPER